MNIYLKLLLLVLLSIYSYFPKIVLAKNLPTLVSTKTTKANLRYGPGKNYPIKLIFLKKKYPIISRR